MALQYGTDFALTITAGSLASAAARSSAAVTSDTTTNLVDYLVEVSILTTATAPSGNKQAIVYAYSSSDGSTYDGASGTVDDVDGTDKALTAVGSPTNLRQIGSVQLNQGAVARTIIRNFSLVQALGFIPAKWGIVLLNDAGTALGATIAVTARPVFYS